MVFIIILLCMAKVMEFRQDGLAFPIRGRTDELVAPRRLREVAGVGAVLGVEFKKQLAPGDLLQAQAEWLMYAPKSMFPYVQVRPTSCWRLWLVADML
jgi:hypothetical protein